MPTIITYTNSSTSKTVKPTETEFTNNTDKTITLEFSSTDQNIAVGTTSGKISKKIVNIKYGAENFYSSKGVDYTIAAHKTVTISRRTRNLELVIP